MPRLGSHASQGPGVRSLCCNHVRRERTHTRSPVRKVYTMRLPPQYALDWRLDSVPLGAERTWRPNGIPAKRSAIHFDARLDDVRSGECGNELHGRTSELCECSGVDASEVDAGSRPEVWPPPWHPLPQRCRSPCRLLTGAQSTAPTVR